MPDFSFAGHRNGLLKIRRAGGEVVLIDGNGAGYWQPGHGEFNTTRNLRVLDVEMLNQELEATPSIYNYQRKQRQITD